MSALEEALNQAKKLKIDESEAVFSSRKITTIRITDSQIIEIKQNQEKNLGIRIVNDKKIASSETRILENAAEAVNNAYDSIKFLKSKNFWKSFPSQLQFQKIEKTYDSKLANIDTANAADIAQEMINSAMDKKIDSISGSLNIVTEKFQIINSSGLNCSDDATYITGVINADSSVEGAQVSGIGQASARTLEKFVPENIGKDAAQMCIGSLNPKNCESETYSIIFEPYSVGEILAFVFASNFNLKTISEKKSCFSNSFEKQVATENFTLLDNPHAPDGIASKPFDDEGVPTKVRPLIEKGIFKNTYSNLYDAFKENKESTGNARREGNPMGRDAEPIPTTSPHNLHVQKGDISVEEMIKDTKKGLLVGRLWYTYAVNPIRGDFSCTARSGIRIIENGEIKNPGKSVRIVHNLPVLLENISAIGNDEKIVQQWASLPSITPSIKAEGIKVTPI